MLILWPQHYYNMYTVNEITNITNPGAKIMPCVKMVLIIFVVLLASGCGKPKEPTPSKAVEDLSGITTIKQGEQMKKKVKEIEKAQEERSKEAEKIE